MRNKPTEAGFRAMALAHASGSDVVIRIDERTAFRFPAAEHKTSFPQDL
jgi:hypothetical protein